MKTWKYTGVHKTDLRTEIMGQGQDPVPVHRAIGDPSFLYLCFAQ